MLKNKKHSTAVEKSRVSGINKINESAEKKLYVYICICCGKSANAGKVRISLIRIAQTYVNHDQLRQIWFQKIPHTLGNLLIQNLSYLIKF
jgi:hypothetical protein